MDPRQFIPWHVPALQTAAAVLFDAYTSGGAADMRSVVVALPGARAGRRLKELLIDEAAHRNVRLVPPRITTAGALPELLHEPHAPLAEPALARRLWAQALRAAGADELPTVFPRAPRADDLRGWLQLAREMERLQSLVGAGGLRFSDVAAACSGDLLFNDEARWRVLARVQDRYYAALQRIGRTDRDEARRRALADGAVPSDGDVWLIGVVDLPGITRALLHALMAVHEGRVRALVHAPEELRDAFDTLGAARPEVWRSARVPLRDDQLCIVGHPSNQAVEAVRTIASFAGRYAADEIVVAVPDTEVVPYLEQRLSAAGVPARYAEGTPVERTAPYRLLAAIADYLGSSASEALAALLRHPDITESLRRRGAPGDTRLDRYLREKLPARLHARSAADGAVTALLRALHHESLLGALTGKRRLGEWMDPVLGVLARIYTERYERDELRREIPRERRVMQLFRMLRDAAGAHTRVPPQHDDVCDAAAAIRILLDDVRGGVIPSEADEPAVELLGWLELHLDDAPAAVLTGMNEPFVPEAVNADPFLPNMLRTRVGLEDNDRRYARYAYQLTAVLHSRADVRVIAGRRTVLGDPIRPSRLLLTETGEALARRITSWLGGEAASADPEPPAAAMPVHDRSSFELPPEPLLRMDAPDSISVSRFRDIIADPYLFALGSLLRLETVDDAARELDPLNFGNFAHDVMESFGRSPAAHSTDEAFIAATLDRLLDDAAADRFGDAAQPAVRVQTEQLRLRLRAFARCHAAWVTDGWRIVAVEAKTPEEGVPFPVDDVPIRLRGRIDRIDYNAGKKMWAVLDYKTGDRAQTPAESHCGPPRSGVVPWRDLQLPLYRHILPHVTMGDGGERFAPGPDEPVLLGYVLLCGEPDATGISLAEWTDEDLALADEAARDVVRTLRRGIFEYERSSNPWLEDDLKALLGFGRLVAAEDEEEELVEEV